MEVVKEEVIEIIKILRKNIINPKINVKLSKYEVSYINDLLLLAEKIDSNDKDVISQIQKEFNKITNQNGKITLEDVSIFISLISKILKSHIIKNTINNVKIINIIQFILDALLDSNLLPINKIETEVIKYLVDESIEFIEDNPNLINDVEEEIQKEEKNIYDFFRMIYLSIINLFSSCCK